jgi:hypothetical protein
MLGRILVDAVGIEPTTSRICRCANPQCSCGISNCKTVSVTKSVTSSRKRCAVGVTLIDGDDQKRLFYTLSDPDRPTPSNGSWSVNQRFLAPALWRTPGSQSARISKFDQVHRLGEKKIGLRARGHRQRALGLAPHVGSPTMKSFRSDAPSTLWVSLPDRVIQSGGTGP